jgi:hypothetical protein
LVKPNAIGVRTRIFVFVDSISPFDLTVDCTPTP